MTGIISYADGYERFVDVRPMREALNSFFLVSQLDASRGLLLATHHLSSASSKGSGGGGSELAFCVSKHK